MLRRTAPVAAALAALLAVPVTASADAPEPAPATHVYALIEGVDGVEVIRYAARDLRAGERRLAELSGKPDVIAAGWDLPVEADDLETFESAEEHSDEAATESPIADGPGDPLRELQWGHDMYGAEDVWTYVNPTSPLRAAEGVTVAVIDSGVDAEHPDLVLPDGTSVVLPGKDYVAGTEGIPSIDENGHGTHVAGIIAAVAQNEVGVAGFAPGVRILPVRVLDAKGAGSVSAITSGIIWAADNGADVINLSLAAKAHQAGGTASAAPLLAAVRYATAHGALVIAAAGNDGHCKDPDAKDCNPLMWPAALPEVESVGAVDWEMEVAPFSTHNAYVDLAAPGVCVTSLNSEINQIKDAPYCPTAGDGYANISGTSMASPYVAAAAALVKSHWSNKGVPLSPRALAHQLRSNAHDAGVEGRDEHYGAGILDLRSALLNQPIAADEDAPVIEVPKDPTVRATTLDENGQAYTTVNYLDWVKVTDGAKATGLADVLATSDTSYSGTGQLKAHCFPIAGTAFYVGTWTVSCTAVNAKGAVGYQEFKVTVTGPGNSAPVPDSGSTVDDETPGPNEVPIPVTVGPTPGVGGTDDTETSTKPAPAGDTPAASPGGGSFGYLPPKTAGTAAPTPSEEAAAPAAAPAAVPTQSVPVPRVVHAG